MISSKEIRKQFIEFFESKAHTMIPSAPVVPIDDPTLLFTNAGMNQFKPIFLGQKEAEVLRAVNSQKCIRAGGKHNDLEEVGKDGYHHTFFEMLGNWSFGDYYKKEAITWAWELLTEVWNLPKGLLYATVHDSDPESFELWKSITDIDPLHISYHGDKDNFWEMGDTGPCGPCSEIHLDRGLAFCDKQDDPEHNCVVNGDCHRYIELWNLVFMQYYRDETGVLHPLANRYVDTGAGLERICQIVQGKSSNYDTDLFVPILQKIAELSGKEYSEAEGVSHRVIADHIRTLCFALADGGLPSNEGRGYVLRRILRRAARHGRLLGFAGSFLWQLVDTIIEVMGHHFVELNGKSSYIKMVIKAEEERFNQTLDKGLEIFDSIVSGLKDNTIPGKDAFMLYDTYGFPPDLTAILAEERGFVIDFQGFNAEMELQRNRARNASKFVLETSEDDWVKLSELSPTEFVGYDNNVATCKIQRWAISADGKVSIQLDKSPFYAESGGQVSDCGSLIANDFEIIIDNVKKIDDYFIHLGIIKRGMINDANVTAIIDTERRAAIAANHTATHLLHKVLRDVLGDHVQQKGSLVTPDYLRFDFTHFEALTHEQLLLIEKYINSHIRNAHAVHTAYKSIDEARQDGAVALFGEKYGNIVRVVNVEGFSMELCGGTHVSNTSQISLFKIRSEASSAAGIRRIEAITGKAVEDYILMLEENHRAISQRLSVPEKQVMSKLDNLISHQSELEKQLSEFKTKALTDNLDALLGEAISINGVTLLCKEVLVEYPESLRKLGDLIKGKAVNMIAVLFAVFQDKVSILCVVSSDLLDRYHAGKIVGKVANLMDGKGGGRPDTAMAGGKHPEMLGQVISQVSGLIFNS